MMQDPRHIVLPWLAVGCMIMALQDGGNSRGMVLAFGPTTPSHPPLHRSSSTAGTRLFDNNNGELADSLRGAAAQVGSDLFVAFRWGAANAFTSSLPEDQRKQLLDRLDPEDPDRKKNGVVDEEEMKHSVNEAVAAALAKESQKEKKRWDREKEEILAQAQEAAEQRVENEIAVQQQRLEQEKRKLQEEAEAKLQQLEREKSEQEAWYKKEMEAQAKEEQKEKDMQSKSMAWKNSTASPTEDDDHPVLGPVIANLGYKRVHLVPASTLGTIPVWRRQRVYRHDRAKAMAADKLKTKHLGLPGVICIHEEENGKLSILDGQHRVGMMKILSDREGEATTPVNGEQTMDLRKVLVEVYPQNTQVRSNDYAQDIFMEINKAEPVKLVDMPGVASAKDRKIISQAVNRLEGQYPKMFSPSQRCRTPHVNVDNLRDNIFASNIIKRNNMKSNKDLLDWMISQNDVQEKKYLDSKDLRKSVNAKAWTKAKTNKFFLGLDSSWLYN